jgi:serine/threonine protein phosphatase 1
MKKKLFVVSDVHSFYSELKVALEKAGFDENNENHWLISCGDAFDRGEESVDMLHYLMSLERKILIRGNHDLLLEDCCKREFAWGHDISNGTAKTINDIGGVEAGNDFDKCCKITLMKTQAYRDMLINYFETKNYIFVHSWIPTITGYDKTTNRPWYKVNEYYEDWRTAPSSEWENAMWENPFLNAFDGLNKTGKTIVFGHWHCSTGYATDSKGEFSEFGMNACWDIYKNETHNIIGIDRCTAYTKEVNVLVVEDDFLGD